MSLDKLECKYVAWWVESIVLLQLICDVSLIEFSFVLLFQLLADIAVCRAVNGTNLCSLLCCYLPVHSKAGPLH